MTSTRDYWDRSLIGLTCPSISDVISRKDYKFILECLCIRDPTEEIQHNQKVPTNAVEPNTITSNSDDGTSNDETSNDETEQPKSINGRDVLIKVRGIIIEFNKNSKKSWDPSFWNAIDEGNLLKIIVFIYSQYNISYYSN